MRTQTERFAGPRNARRNTGNRAPAANVKQLRTGIALRLAAATAILLGQIGWLAAHVLSTLTVASIIGIAPGTTFHPIIGARCSPGAIFSTLQPAR